LRPIVITASQKPRHVISYVLHKEPDVHIAKAVFEAEDSE
jgi:hypothetical protein